MSQVKSVETQGEKTGCALRKAKSSEATRSRPASDRRNISPAQFVFDPLFEVTRALNGKVVD